MELLVPAQLMVEGFCGRGDKVSDRNGWYLRIDTRKKAAIFWLQEMGHVAVEGFSAMEFPVLVEVNPGRVLVDQASHLGTTTATYAIAARGVPILIVS